MKRFAALCMGVVTAFSVVAPVSAFAEESYAAPTFYFGADSSQNIEVDGDTVTIRRDAFSENGFTLNVDVYIDDPDLRSWYVSPKWKCASEYITLSNVFTPNVENYEFAYGIVENDKLKYMVTAGEDDECNTMYFTCQPGFTASDRSAMKPLGATSDAYPLTNFDAEISSDIPDGTYEIYFLTEAEDYEGQHASSGSFRYDDGTAKIYDSILKVRSLTVVIDSNPKEVLLGDVDSSGVVDAVDATLVLQHYSYKSMGDAGIFNEEQVKIANVDGSLDENGLPSIDAVDATHILGYYSYVSMLGEISWDDYFAMGK